jgi:hypothetical protein
MTHSCQSLEFGYTDPVLSMIVFAALECHWLWTVTMPSGSELHYTGQHVENGPVLQDGFTDIWVYYKDEEAGRMCMAPGHKWFFLSSFDHTGDTSNWTRSVH